MTLNIFSRRKRMLKRTSARASSGPVASSRAGSASATSAGESQKVRARTRVLLLIAKVLRIRGFKANRDSGPIASAGSPAMPTGPRTKLRRVVRRPRMLSSDHRVRRTLRRNRALVVALLAVGGLVALLTGISVGQGSWNPPFTDLSQPPSPRFGQASTYDWARDRVLVFGGFVSGTNPNSPTSLGGPPISNNNQTYLYQSSWERRDPSPSPTARGFAAMAYDGARKNVVLFGGGLYNSNTVFGDTWTWDGGQWTLQDPPKPVPDPRQNAAMVYDPHRKEVMMFGGRDANGKPMNDTWVWNGKFWKIKPPEGAPSPRHSAAIAYDECRAEAVMFGGVGDPINSFHRAPSETWTWNGSTWTPKAPLISPPPRVGGHLVYSDRTRDIQSGKIPSDRTGNILLYGGLITNEAGVPTVAADHDMWRWVPELIDAIPDGPTSRGFWERMNTESGPADNWLIGPWGDGVLRTQAPPRAYATFVHVGGPFSFLFGGTPSAGTSNVQFAHGDTNFFYEQGTIGPSAVSVGNVLGECADPIPVPEGDPSESTFAGPEFAAREGMRETDQLPVLIGTDWPGIQRNTHKNYNGGPPNPNYTPAPECPNRSPFGATSGNNETGGNTHLVTDSTRNRVYQFFICDWERGQGYLTPTYYTSMPPVYNTLIEAYDGTTLEPLGRTIARNVRASQYESSSRLIHDPVQGRFLVRTSDPSELVSIQKDRIEKGLDPVEARRNFSTFPQRQDGSPNFNNKNFFRHPTTGLPKLFYFRPAVHAISGGATAGPPPVAHTPPRLGQWDLEEMKSDWEAPAPSVCTGGSGQDTAGALGVGTLGGVAMRSGERVYTTCHVGNGQWAVLRISLTGNTDGSETPGTTEVFPGPSFQMDAWGDPQTERMIIVTNNLSNEKKIWVFDGKVSRWVGRVGLGIDGPGSGGTSSSIQFGFDDSAARLYLHMADHPKGNTRGGVRIVDTRLTPVAQTVDFPQFASISYTSPAFLAGPGGARRVFIRTVGPSKMKKYPNWETVEFKNEMFYRVLADEVPVPKALSLSDLDALTVPVPETPGKTDVSFDAEGSAYGIRLRSIGGIWTAARPFQQAFSGMDPWTEGSAMPIIRPFIPACVFPDRELMAGFVPQARLSDLDALARSSGLEVDSNSKVDLTGPTSRCQPTADATNFPPSIKVVFDVLWPLKLMVESEVNEAAGSGVTAEAGQQSGTTTEHLDTPLGTLDVFEDAGGKPTGAKAATTSSSWDSHFKEVVCVGDALKTYQAAVGNIYGSSDCIQTQGLVKATARGSATGVGPLAEEATKQGFSVGEGYSNVVVSRDPEKGVVVTSTAVAKGIQIPGLSIDRVETTAVAWSNGRPGEERALFTRDICGVHTPDGSIPGCLSSGNQQEFVTRWNSGWGKNSQIYLPKPDPGYYNGSPGGYIAGVLKPLADEIEDQLFAKDFQKEVPGLEIHFYKDSQFSGDARQTLQLAATRAIAGFGVQCDPDYLYSPQTETTPATCVLIPEDLPEEEYWEEGEDEFYEEEESELDGEWISADALGPTGPSFGSRIGKLLENLPVIRQLPIRQIAEALLAGSVWWLLGLPLFLASRRFALSQWRTN